MGTGLTTATAPWTRLTTATPPAPGEASGTPRWTGEVSRWLGSAPRLLAGLLTALREGWWWWWGHRWWWRRRRPLGPLRRGRDQQQLAEETPVKKEWPGGEEDTTRGTQHDHFEVSFNLLRHLFDMCVVTFLCLASPVFRMSLDVLGLKDLLGLWLHGMGLFLVVSYGMMLVLWFLQTYLPLAALVYGTLLLLVLGVSLRPGHPQEPLPIEGVEVPEPGPPHDSPAGEPVGL
ncbi:uncharacterized protein C6orf47 homolog [Amblyraja radiata]|uniref:uncharacterized protein C6orf47 homolog n=1 Tax=Amblyraja radiata TaxID=386614 RepID=UPI001402D43B|nr:uncharacterized protein C6orf47 homolog [Amblyraja radiata]